MRCAAITIEIQQPKLEMLIQQRMASGRFRTVEEALMQALESAPLPGVCGQDETRKQTLEQMFAQARGLTDDVEFARDSSADRVIDLA